MPKRLELIGQRFGRLTVLAFEDFQNRHSRWRCRCECGRSHVAMGGHLKSGLIQSCGCYARERTIADNTTHGLSRVNGKWTPEYATWRRMKERCHNPNNPHFADYGGRGIIVSPLWREDYPEFFAHVGPRPSPQHSIDRINNDGDYAPGNVRWATRSEQSLNTRKAGYGRWHDLDDRTISLQSIADHLAMPRMSLKLLLQRAGIM